MAGILADILTLIQYQEMYIKDTKQPRLERCLCCGKAKLHRHGSYPRKADRSGESESLNPIFIQRYYCPECRRTCSALPECMPPYRWYLWEVQQAALTLLLAGKSVYAASKVIAPSRHTIARWWTRFHERFRLHKDILCNHIADLGRTIAFSDFWINCLQEIPLSKAMRLCHVAGAFIP